MADKYKQLDGVRVKMTAEVTAEACTSTWPTATVNGIPPGDTLASASTVTVPALIVRALPVTSNTEPAKASTCPTDIVN